MTELLYCPACEFTFARFCRHLDKIFPETSDWEKMRPHIYKDRFLNEYVIECQNCGVELINPASTEEELILTWNTLSRKSIPSEALCFFQDGDSWCCVGGDFIDIQNSPCGFGGTFNEALDNYRKEIGE